jgi:hypothetical protein
MDNLKTVADKQEMLKKRREEERKLGATIDQLMSKAAEPTPGCGLCGIWKRLTRSQRHVVVTMASAEAADSAGVAGSSQVAQVAKAVTSSQSRLFGMKKQSANEKLAQAAEALKSRLLQLESRAASEREEAKVAVRSGQKASALRMLKRAKMTDKHVGAAQQSLLAIEQQVDLMAQAAMQKEIASALATSSKGFKANKKMVQNAEAAVDDAQEARDMAEDLSNALSELGGQDTGDDDELLEELRAMAADDEPANEIARVDVSLSDESQAARQLEIAKLEAHIARYDEVEELRQKLPVAPKRVEKGEERQGLLSAS